MTDSPQLSKFQQDLVLSVHPSGSKITSAEYFRESGHPCPMQVQVILPSGEQSTVVLRLGEAVVNPYGFGIERETQLLPILAELGLPVPKVLAGPVSDPSQPDLDVMSVITLLPGEDFLALGRRVSLQERKALEPHLLSAIMQLQQVTEPLSHFDIAAEIPRFLLRDWLQPVIEDEALWPDEPIFRKAIQVISPLVEQVRTPLVFTNGDPHPTNFLSDGKRLTGIIDFHNAWFEDPLYWAAEYLSFDPDWLPYDATALVNQYVEIQNFTMADLNLRVAVACLEKIRYFMRLGLETVGKDKWTFHLRRLHDAVNGLS